MQDWIIFILVLFIALTVSFITASKTDFVDYVFLPWRPINGPWRQPWWRRPWWRREQWVGPRYQYVTYLEPFSSSEAGSSRQACKASEPFVTESDTRQAHKVSEPFVTESDTRQARKVSEPFVTESDTRQAHKVSEPFSSSEAGSSNKTKPKDEIEYSEDIQAKMKKHEMEMLRLSPENMSNSAMPDLFTQKPYHLLGDEYQPVEPEKISCVNSRNCYATSFDRFLEQTGNFRQMTNNYKRGYPDSCSSPLQELVLSFYKTTPMKMDRPTNCL
jgi:hypothetical protein